MIFLHSSHVICSQLVRLSVYERDERGGQNLSFDVLNLLMAMKMNSKKVQFMAINFASSMVKQEKQSKSMQCSEKQIRIRIGRHFGIRLLILPEHTIHLHLSCVLPSKKMPSSVADWLLGVTVNIHALNFHQPVSRRKTRLSARKTL